MVPAAAMASLTPGGLLRSHRLPGEGIKPRISGWPRCFEDNDISNRNCFKGNANPPFRMPYLHRQLEAVATAWEDEKAEGNGQFTVSQRKTAEGLTVHRMESRRMSLS